MQAASNDEEPITAINVTPLVDVSLVLVIILMVTTPMMSQSRLSVTLPKAATDEHKNEEYVTITIDNKGATSVNEKQVYTPKELEQTIAIKLAKTNDKVVIIKADNDVDHGTVIDVMDAAKKSKPRKIYFATQIKKDKL